MHYDVVISGTGLFTPPEKITNEELVQSYNTYADQYNKTHAAAISAGQAEALDHSDADFIVKASGIRSRFTMDKKNVLNPDIMMPQIPERANEALSVVAEMAVAACRQAMEQAGKEASDIDAVLYACSAAQRPYPAMAVEIQDHLGIDGFGFDMNVACSSATFAVQTAADMIRAGRARAVLVTNPEFASAHMNFRDRDSHFIFGDVATAILLERKEGCTAKDQFEVISTKLKTSYSNNIRNNFGFVNRCEVANDHAESTESGDKSDRLFVQQGRKVFREVTPMVAAMIKDHLQSLDLSPDDIRRFWLHQANIHMNEMIGKTLLGDRMSADTAPIILDEYANTAAAGSIIAFHKHNQDIKSGDLGLICSFGAGYSIGSVVVRKV